VNIILGSENISGINDKYVVLELDQLLFSNRTEPLTAYCIVENIGFDELATVEQFRDLHNNLVKNYRLGNWKYCEDALEYLRGRWHKEVDTFYDDLTQRIAKFKTAEPDPNWNGIVKVAAPASGDTQLESQ